MVSTIELSIFIDKLYKYEPGIVKIIEKFMTTYTFKSSEQLKDAVDLWCKEETRKEAESKYGHISYWNVSKISNMMLLFRGKKDFNDDISRWDVSKVYKMELMFADAYNFNQPLNDWDVSNVYCMDCMFNYALKFNQPLYKWDVKKVEGMACMFFNAKSFNQDLREWKPYNVYINQSMFYKCGIISNYKPIFL